MKSFRGFIKKHKVATSLILLGVFIIVFAIPFLINLLFKIPAVNEWFVAEWEAADALAYYGAVLAFLSTAFLSGLALWQNHVIKEGNEAHMKRLEQMERDKNAPYIVFNAPGTIYYGDHITFSLQNTAENNALDVWVSNLEIIDSNGKPIWKSEIEHSKDCLEKNGILRVRMEDIVFYHKYEGNVLRFDLSYYDLFGEKHFEQRSCILMGKNRPPQNITQILTLLWAKQELYNINSSVQTQTK